jgi:FAD/FMN-containing dehydrogenase
MSISGKNDIDWRAFGAALGDIAVIDKAPLVKRKSRDFFWYSPVLKRQLSACYGDLVARPKTEAELQEVMAQAYAWKVPVTLRGGGTGNYGQAVPLDGGLIIEMTGLEEILEIGPDFVKVQAGCNIHRLNQALREVGCELPIFPSTERMSTIGGFIGGGSGGIGSIEHGMLRDRGNIMDLTVLTMEESPRRLVLMGEDINIVHHAWGINGVIVALTLKTVPARDWINCIASFESYQAAFEAGLVLSERTDLRRKLVTSVDARIVAYFDKLQDRLGAPRDLLLTLIAREDVAAFADLAVGAGGRADLCLDGGAMTAAGLPQVAEFSFNHTTLLVLKVDKSVTYLQVRVPAPIDSGKVAALAAHFGDEVLMHHEFIRLGGELVAIDLPVVRYSDDERLYQIIRTYEEWGFPVSDPHTCIIEDGGMKRADYRHLATKKRFDPLGLLNSGKSREWARVKEMTPEEIEGLQPREGEA